MDTSTEAVRTDKLGRRCGPRRKYALAEKLAIVAETKVRGASVAEVAQRHQLNANLLFGWRRLVQRGVLSGSGADPAVALLPVKIATPTVVPTERARARMPATQSGGSIEIEFAGGQRVRIHGRVDRATLSRVLAMLSRR